ncbi:alpha-mannosidase [Pediococcus ethanolidurans]|uniref:glycoside hydrolase family 38 N-terminal domain-containing protein n=1 Tax=Pediococcus ethanolidurans TaxID=319653 RepID=UPI0021E82843|nr:glycoside hydrolase family 38 C-terminal domain-containing protein [Pediococcus ethanolidurans]MCV3327782.1 alpha-mannosidase [Pediococcus ethanolidurans]
MTQTNLVNHTHWDREWYFTTMDALVLSDQLFTEVLDELEKHPEANFCLDGQISVVDEYVEIHPEAKKRIQRLVKEGRLFVGPWYTQTDALIPDTESILRNLIIGVNDTREKYGQPMMVGYLPDTFGFNAQLPTILHQVGIDNFVFWRGTNFRTQMNSVYFKWQGLSGKDVYAANFPFGYFTAQIDVESKKNLKEFVDKRFDPAADFEATHSKNADVLMPSGIDQMNIIKNIHQTISDLNKLSKNHTVISSYPKFIDKLRQRTDLPTYQGELRLPTYARVHRTIGSVRHQIKTDNFYLEQKILRRVEPLMVIAHKNGLNIGNGLLIKLWKKLLECQAHDTLGGSVSDNVAVDIKHRFKEANEIADGIENMIKKKLAEFLNLGDHDVLVFNTDPFKFSGKKIISLTTSSKNIEFDGLEQPVIIESKHYPVRHHILMMTPRGQEYTDEPEYYELKFEGNIELPALGYKVIHFNEGKQPAAELLINSDSNKKNEIQFKNQRLNFVNGTINYSNQECQITDAIQLMDSGNDGDTYDYSPLNGDSERALDFQNAQVEEINGKVAVLIVRGTSKLPLHLEDRVATKPQYQAVSYTLRLSFDEQGLIEGKLDFDNQVYSHRLRLKLNPQIKNAKTIAHIQDGFVQTINHKISDDWEKEFVEKPVNIYSFDKTVSIVGENKHMTFLGKGMKEYEAKNNGLYVTLMATTGQLGKPNLAWRPGRASGDTTNQGHVMMATPLAEELGHNRFEFALSFAEKKFSEHETSMLMHRWLSPSISYQMQKLNLFINRLDNKIWPTEDNPIIPDSFSLLEIQDLLVAAVYPSYLDADAYIVRIQNPTKQVVKIPEDLLGKADVVNALEEPVQSDGTIGKYDMITLKFKY